MACSQAFHPGFVRWLPSGSNPKGGCMSKGFTRLATTLAAVAALAIGASAIATGAPTKPQKPAKPVAAAKAHAKKAQAKKASIAKKSSSKDSGETPETAGAPENAADDSAQAAACAAAGVT